MKFHLNLNLRLTPGTRAKQQRIDALLSQVFRHRKWLLLITDHSDVDPLLIGTSLHRLYRGSPAAPGDYLMLILSDANPICDKTEMGRHWHEQAFFESLQPHTRVAGSDELVFAASGLVLNVREVLEEPVHSRIPSARICRPALFGFGFTGRQTWCCSLRDVDGGVDARCQSQSRWTCRKCRIEVSEGWIVLYR